MSRFCILSVILACGVLFPANSATAGCTYLSVTNCTVDRSCARVGDTIVVGIWACVAYPGCWELVTQVTQDPVNGLAIELSTSTTGADCGQIYFCSWFGPLWNLRVPLPPGCAPKLTVIECGDTVFTAGLGSALRGDLNLNGLAYEMSDLVTLINVALRNERPAEGLRECWPVQADLDYNGRLNLVDIVRMCRIITGKVPPPSL